MSSPTSSPAASSSLSGFDRADEALFYPLLTVILLVVLATLIWGAPALFVAALSLTPVALLAVIALTLRGFPASD